jgi:hypothetical protein
MLSNRYGSPYWQIATLAVMAALWIALSVPLVSGRGDAEAFLLNTFEHSYRTHPFVSLNPTFFLFWIAHSCLLIFGIVAVMVHESDLFTVLIIGPTLASGVSLFSQQWSDPDWLLFAGVCLIGWLVGIVAGGAYWFFVHHLEQRDAMDSRQRRG